MSKFNNTKQTTTVENAAGGKAYSQTAHLELVSLLLTTFVEDDFYRAQSQTLERLRELILKSDKQFVAKAAIYARTVFGMRSITHAVASELGKHVSGLPWAAEFYKQIVYRPDDIMEILSYHKAVNGKIPKAMQAGLARAFDKFDAYSLAKYKGEGKEFKLADAMNILHPIPCERNAEALQQLAKGTLKAFDTWENELSAAGQGCTGEEKAVKKAAVWKKLLSENKLGYFALLRNLRNIIEQAPEALPMALTALTDEKSIKKSLVLPFRFLTAFSEIDKLNDSKAVRSVLVALNKAVDISLGNIPEFPGDTLVVLDCSGSMVESHMGNKSPHMIGKLFAAAIVKRNNADLILFSDNARYHKMNPADSTITMADSINFKTGGTNFPSIFQTANKKYDRVIILSDMQGWMGGHTPTHAYNEYKRAHGAAPFIYSFDLKNYGTMQFPEKSVFAVAGFSEKIFDVMALMEKDKNAFFGEISKINLENK